MSMEQALFAYVVVFCILLVPTIWLLIRWRAKRKAEKSQTAANNENSSIQPERPLIDWDALLALRPRAVLTGEMWLKTFVAAFVALCVGVIVVVFVFPLGALWAASATFVAVLAVVILMITLID